ncbi:MAG: MBL fold metallo-hydrolase [Planctomycetota bacterium]|nr:MBL fold metallo-hydrolase [Planctomycetota bacterium]
MHDTRLRQLILATILAVAFLGLPHAAAEPPRFEQLAVGNGLDLFVWKDVCNAYVLRDGEAALLIDVGDGSVLEHLGELGVRRLEWVLPDYRKLKPSLGDAWTVHGASYVRPPVEPLAIQRTFKTMDTFTWHGREFWCLETAGNSPGSMSYLLKTDRGWLAFSGDVMLAGGRLHNWFDTEWDYGFAKGLYTLIEAVSLLERFEPTWLLPSHGPVIAQPVAELHAYQQKLRRLARLYVRGYNIFTFAGADQDKVSRPSVVPHLWQTTPHVFKFKGPEHSPNFYLLLADSGRALLVDCGVDKGTLDATFQQLRERLGLKAIDAILITHMHGDTS